MSHADDHQDTGGGRGGMRNDTHVYIGTMICGCHVAAVVDMIDLPKSTAKSVAEMFKSGLTVTRREIALLRDGSVRIASCTHKQGSLL